MDATIITTPGSESATTHGVTVVAASTLGHKKQIVHVRRAAIMSTSIRNMVFGCMSDRSQEASQLERRVAKVRFGVPLSEAIRDGEIPGPLLDIVGFIARDGVTTNDLFRRPGNSADMKLIMKRLHEGKEIILTNYNFYTLASVIKKFLLKLPDGLLGSEVEEQLLEILEVQPGLEQFEAVHSIVDSLPEYTQHLVCLLLGTWFRIINHSEINSMSSEAVAKSVAGSFFHTCAEDPSKIQRAVCVLEILIENFGVANMLGRKNIQYFADTTRTGIRVKEKFRYEYRFPSDNVVPYVQSLQAFIKVLETEADRWGFDLTDDAITEEEYYGTVQPRSPTKDSRESQSQVRILTPEHSCESTTPELQTPESPRSLQPDQVQDLENNKHLANISSISAPEVNTKRMAYSLQKFRSMDDGLETNDPKIKQTVSLNQFEQVRRKQMARMKRRSNWFLAPDQSFACDESGSHTNSRETSMEATTLSDVLASDAGVSEHTASDHEGAGISGSEGTRLSDADSMFTMGEHDRLITPASEPVARRVPRLEPDSMSDTTGLSVSSKSQLLHKEPSDLTDRDLTENEMRYFMVENWYGSAKDSGS